MPSKFTMMFNVPNGGFSESWYWNGPVALPVGPASVFDQLADLRGGMLATESVMIGYRISDIDNPRVSQLKLYPKTLRDIDKTDIPSSSWLAIAKGANGVGRRQLWIRGVSDDAIQFNDTANKFEYNPAFNVAWTNYKAFLTAGANLWSIKHVQSKKEAGAGVVTVTMLVNNAAANNITLQCTQVFDPTKPIIVGGFKKPLSRLNGTYLPNDGWVPVPTGIQLIGKAVPAYAAAGYPGGGNVRQQVVTLTKVANIELEFARDRKIGRAFFQQRGRR